MFNNIKYKLECAAYITFFLGVIAACFDFIGFIVASDTIDNSDLTVLGIVSSVVILLFSLILAFIIFGFSKILENLEESNNILKIVHADDIARQQRIAQEAAEAAEAARQARIDAYWSRNYADKVALLEKRNAINERLNGPGKISKKLRAELENLIQAINEELTKDREG